MTLASLRMWQWSASENIVDFYKFQALSRPRNRTFAVVWITALSSFSIDTDTHDNPLQSFEWQPDRNFTTTSCLATRNQLDPLPSNIGLLAVLQIRTATLRIRWIIHVSSAEQSLGYSRCLSQFCFIIHVVPAEKSTNISQRNRQNCHIWSAPRQEN